MLKRAYFSFIALAIGAPMHFVADHWATFVVLMAALASFAVFLTIGLWRRP
jgi:hypothetical protein